MEHYTEAFRKYCRLMKELREELDAGCIEAANTFEELGKILRKLSNVSEHEFTHNNHLFTYYLN